MKTAQKVMSEASKTDHRTRVAAERRERMRARLAETALAIFAEKGVGASVIQDVIATAGVSQGTFYNYFRTNEELLLAVAEELSNELIDAIERTVSQYEDPAERIATGVRLYLYKARAFPLFASFVVQTGLHLASPNNLIYEYVPQHLEAGFASGRFQRMPMEVAVDLIGGQALMAIARLEAGGAAEDYPEWVVATLLRALGVAQMDAQRIAFEPLQPVAIPEDSLVARATIRANTLVG
ncbi:TetR/AcrR family transcriptional regulator [Cupriavidus consociatus]|uniref:TetR/AcrR family transcriptional regulator n=1 Tax=Cupriavidus consociatus TaxID=2821357 RepID=UPI001FD8227D|nr:MULTISPECIES: TetR/AcrR family transcriptional regulator [unclassified Cupriavidus]MDK2659917.1 TetR/AcrR family transcriptional regulator [Cupriavidus sp. LEh21]